MSKRAAIYARVSTTDQADKGYSLPSQLDACRRYAEGIGCIVTAEFSEDISGTKPISERVQGGKLADMIKRREVDVVIVHVVDRLSRDIVDLLPTIRIWLRSGVEIYAGDIGQIESENDILLVIKGWQGGDETKKIRERSMRGKRTKALAGRVVGHRPPFGYKHVRDKNGKVENFEIAEEEAQVVRLIYQWYVYGDDEGKRLSTAAIAKRLSLMKIPTPGERQAGYHRTRESGMWNLNEVLIIISNEVYAGIWRFGMRIGESHNLRPPEEWISVNVPAIIDRTTWEAAQKQKSRNKAFAKRNAKHNYLLSGLLRCGECGSSMSGGYFGEYCYYSCTWANNHHAGLEKSCKARRVRAEAIEADIWDSVVNLFADTPELERLLRIAQEEELQTLDPKRQELETIERMILDAEHEAMEIGQALKRAIGIVSKTLEHDMQDINRRYEALVQRQTELQSEISFVRLTDATIKDALRYAEDVRLGIENADFETKRRNLETLQVEVVIQVGRFYVTSLAGKWYGEIRSMARKGNIVTSWQLPASAQRSKELFAA